MVLRSLKGSTRHKYGFYECGFRPKNEYSLKFNLHSFVICSMAILYDVESLYLILFMLNINLFSLVDFGLLFFYLSTFLIGFVLEFISGSSEWHFY